MISVENRYFTYENDDAKILLIYLAGKGAGKGLLVCFSFWRSDNMKRWKKSRSTPQHIIGVCTVVVIFYLWWYVTDREFIKAMFLPSPGQVWETFKTISTEGNKGNTLGGHMLVSMKRLVIAMFFAIVTAIPFGLVCGYFKNVKAVFEPILAFYRPLPPLAYYSLLVLWLGIDDSSKITLLFLAGFSPIYISCMASISRVKEDYIYGSYSMGASRFQTFLHVILPSALPDIFIGLRNALSGTYRTLVAAEMVAAVSGIGWMVVDAGDYLRSDVIFVGIIVMGITGLILENGILWIEKKIVPWKGKE